MNTSACQDMSSRSGHCTARACEEQSFLPHIYCRRRFGKIHADDGCLPAVTPHRRHSEVSTFELGAVGGADSDLMLTRKASVCCEWSQPHRGSIVYVRLIPESILCYPFYGWLWETRRTTAIVSQTPPLSNANSTAYRPLKSSSKSRVSAVISTR